MWAIMVNGKCVGMLVEWDDAALIEECYANAGEEVELEFLHALSTLG